MNEEKITIKVVGTSPMKNTKTSGALVYYTFELDLLFKPRLYSDPPIDPFELALECYKLMKPKGSVVSKNEELVLRMLLERGNIGKRLKPGMLRLRRAYFMIRNMIKARYIS